MLKVELHNHHPKADSAPSFATSAEIEIADQLRHQLEQRYLAPSAAPPPLPALSSDSR